MGYKGISGLHGSQGSRVMQAIMVSLNYTLANLVSTVDCEQSLFCSKIPAGGAARKRVRYSSREPRAASREPRAASREPRAASREPRVAWAGDFALRSLSRPRYSRLAARGSRLAARGSRLAARISYSLSRRSSGRDFRAKERLLAVY